MHQKFKVIEALSGETRYKIATALIENGPTSVEGIADKLGMTHSAISHQLGNLHNADVVSYEKSGRHMIYQIAKSDAGKVAKKIMRV